MYGDGGMINKSGSVARKMSSPSLEQYHVASQSPEQRRASVIDTHNPAFTLPPLQSYNQTPHQIREEQGYRDGAHGHDNSHLLAGIEQYTGQQEGPVRPDIQREPSYTRDEPTSTQIRGAPDSQEADAVLAQSMETEGRGAFAPLKLERTTSLAESIPAFIPVPAVKREASSQVLSPLRESSMPVPTTENMTTPDIKSKKRPAPKSNKKGTAKKGAGPPAKKRKTEANNDGSKSKSARNGGNLLGKKTASASATPFNSSPAPRSVRSGRSSASADPGPANSDDDEDEEEPGTPGTDDEVYCLCRRPDTGTFMIGCDGGCDDWFHGKCVGISEKDKGLIDRYICPTCEKKGVGITTWKRMCRRPGCRMPARLGKKKGEPTSKYCSENCGMSFFNDMISTNTRGASDAIGRKSGRRKSVSGDAAPDNHGAGARGGVLSVGEVKSLVTSVSGIDEFQRLGDGVLSPPTTPSPNDSKFGVSSDDTKSAEGALNDTEVERMTKIVMLKEQYRTRHALLKDRIKFITMLKQAATQLAEGKGMKPKEMCGYDDRISWTEEQFSTWRASSAGSQALQAGTLEAAKNVTDAQGDSTMDEGQHKDDPEVCTKRKCARHYDWAKLSLDEARFEIGENSEDMRGLEREEKEMRERAALRARELLAGNVGGFVDMHSAKTRGGDVHGTSDQMELDQTVSAEATAYSSPGASEPVRVEQQTTDAMQEDVPAQTTAETAIMT